jgi:shikimate kinase
LTPENEVDELLSQRASLYREVAQITIPVASADPILAVLEALDAHPSS